jgi:hypothetical protein
MFLKGLKNIKNLKDSPLFEGWIFLRRRVWNETPVMLDPLDRAIPDLWTGFKIFKTKNADYG